MSTITELNRKKKSIESEIEEEKYKRENQDEKIRKLNSELYKVNKRINNLTKNVVVSEHAIVRYMERVMGVDIQEIRDKILSDKFVKMVKELGNANYPIDGTTKKAVVKDNIVITIR